MKHRLIHFESRHQQLLPKKQFYNRLLKSLLAGVLIILFFLGLGVAGYHLTCGMGFLDSLLNASMILSGMGPVTPITTDNGKIFASCYALVSGVVFITAIGIIVAPVTHRIFHRFHIEDSDESN
ncbi:MAG: hypothetical protein IT262_13815 [Saprospiraceae bacterium]|nr:hypothetical protein [Saprospiraceae bacterium]